MPCGSLNDAFSKAPSVLPGSPVAGNGDLLAVQVRDDDAVMRAVGDEQALAGRVGEHLAGEEQRAVARFAEAGQLETSCGLVLSVFFSLWILISRAISLIQVVVLALARVHVDRPALPGRSGTASARSDVVGLPDVLVGVVDHRMGDLVAEDGLADAGGFLLVVELGRVDADDHQLVGIFLLQLGQVGQDVDAVDAAQRPEVEQDDLAAAGPSGGSGRPCSARLCRRPARGPGAFAARPRPAPDCPAETMSNPSTASPGRPERPPGPPGGNIACRSGLGSGQMRVPIATSISPWLSHPTSTAGNALAALLV